MIAKTVPSGIRGVHVAVMMIAFFAIIIALDALFITFAIQSHPGEQVKNSYVLGLEYNNELARRAEQRALGWNVTAGVVDEGATFLVKLTDAEGSKIAGKSVAVRMHVAGIRKDLEMVWLTERAPGEYSMSLTKSGPARIEALISVHDRRGALETFQASKTLVLK